MICIFRLVNQVIDDIYFAILEAMVKKAQQER